MKLILDECLPRRLLKDLSNHSATTVPRQGWAGVTNGALLERVGSEIRCVHHDGFQHGASAEYG